MTLQQLAEALVREQGDNINDTAFVARVVDWIKESLSEINTVVRWSFAREHTTISTAIGDPTLTLPASAKEVMMLYYSPSKVVEHLATPMALADRGVNFSETGTPEYWWFDAPDTTTDPMRLVIRVHPIPDAIYAMTLVVAKDIMALAASDTVPLPGDFIPMLKHRVRVYLLSDDKDYDGADRAMQNFNTALALAVRRTQNNPAARLSNRLQVNDISGGPSDLARLDPSRY